MTNSKTRVIVIPANATALIIAPLDDGKFNLSVDSSVTDLELAEDHESTPERECALAAFTACSWLRNGHPADRDKKRIIVPGSR